jgi:hypothetical protein
MSVTALAAVIDGSVKSSSRAAAPVRIEGLHFIARCSSRINKPKAPSPLNALCLTKHRYRDVILQNRSQRVCRS